LVSEASFVILVSGAVLLGLIVAFIDRVLKFSFKDLSVEFAKVEQARIEVEATREEVERIAISIADITGFLAAFHRRLGSEQSHKLEAEWLEAKISTLLQETQISSEVREKAFRWLRAVRHMDAMKENGEKSNDEWDRVWATVEEEIKEANKASRTNRP
jgi:predicted RNase H-like nuclease (RuvC/YqgF family)